MKSNQQTSEYSEYGSFISKLDLQIILLPVLLTLIFRLVTHKCRREARFVKAASFLPGPPEIPLLGNGLAFLFPGKGGIPDLETRYTEKYGSMYRIWFGNQLWISFSNPEDLQVIYQSTKVAGRQTILPSLRTFFGEGISSTSSIPRWKSERLSVQPKLTKKVLKAFVYSVNQIISNFIDELHSRANGKEFDVKKLYGDLTLDVLAKIEYGYALQSEEKKKLDTLDNAEKIVSSISAQLFLPILNAEPLNFIIYKMSIGPVKSMFRDFIKKMLVKQPELIRETANRENEDKSKMTSMSFVSTLYQMNPGTANEKLMLDELLTLFIPAVSPVARILSYSTLMIAIHPDIQEKLYQEICHVLGDEDKWPEYDDLARLTYLDQIFKESLRLYNSTTVSFRELDEDMDIKSYRFPAGTGILINSGAIHLNPEYYPKPKNFNPENFCPEAVAKRPKYSFIPFGGGARKCIGQEYATVLFKLTLISLVRNFKVHTTMKHESIKIIHHMVTFLQNGNYVALTKRVKE